jgi:hypothetical protein
LLLGVRVRTEDGAADPDRRGAGGEERVEVESERASSKRLDPIRTRNHGYALPVGD